MSLEHKAGEDWKAFKFAKPQKLQAEGFLDGKPRYFPCAGCEEVKAIAGYVARELGDLNDIQVIEKETRRYLAYYWKNCFTKMRRRNGEV